MADEAGRDARFGDAGGTPLRLLARDADDLAVIAAACRDAVLTDADLSWQPRRRRFALLLNRFRWEDPAGRAERARAVLAFGDVMGVASDGVSRGAGEVLSLLDLTWAPGPDGTGTAWLVFRGDGAVRLRCEALEATLQDVTRPYEAPSGRAPDHGD